MSAITKVLVAALAFGAVQALPQQNYAPSSTTAAPPAQTSDQSGLFKDLFTAPTAVKRFQRLLTAGGELLTGDALKQLVVFNFKATPNPDQLGGVAKAANIETFPILTDLGISVTTAFMSACGMNTPHIHPRATEFLTVVEGGDVKFGYILENQFVDAGKNAEVAGSLQKFEGTVFPMGSIHYQFNDNCKPSTFVAALNSEDPGTSQIAQNFFGLNPDIVNATLGFPKQIDGSNIAQFRKSLPVNLAQGIDKCLARCNLTIAEFPLQTRKA